MSEVITVTVKVKNKREVATFTVAELADFSFDIAAGATDSEVTVPGITDPSFVAVFADGYTTTSQDPVEVKMAAQGAVVTDVYPIACAPVALWTSDTDEAFSADGGGGAAFSLFFTNPGGSPAHIRVFVGGNV